jgi:hypothetical protein
MMAKNPAQFDLIGVLIFHIPPDLVVERARRSLKASGREDLQIEEPITGG